MLKIKSTRQSSLVGFYLHTAAISILLLTAILLLVRSQPYDDHELRQLLLPEGCPAPCFMGIRPGATMPDKMHTLHHEKILDYYVFSSGIEKTVIFINVTTSIKFGEVFLLLGGGDLDEHYSIYNDEVRAYIAAEYSSLSLFVGGKLECPSSVHKYWNTDVTLNVAKDVFLPPDPIHLCPRVY